jgi:hypothetical protein
MVEVARDIWVVHFLYCVWSNGEESLWALVLLLLRMGLFDEWRIMQLFAIIEFLWRCHHFPLLTDINVMLLFILLVEFDFYHLRNRLTKLKWWFSLLFFLFTRCLLRSKCQPLNWKESWIVNLLVSVWYKFIICP